MSLVAESKSKEKTGKAVSVVAFSIDSDGVMRTCADFKNKTDKLALLTYMKWELEWFEEEEKAESRKCRFS